MFEILEVQMGSRPVIAVIDKADTFEAAKMKVKAMGVVMITDDADNADCADAYLKDGRCVAIQPKGFVAG